MLGRFEKAYRAIEDPVTDAEGRPVEIRADLRRQLVHMRLNLALLKPGRDLPSGVSFDPCLAMTALNAEALEALSAFLAPAAGRSGQERGIGAATMPTFIRSLLACRGLGADDVGYDAWRERWFRLDRYAGEAGRLERVREALAAAR